MSTLYLLSTAGVGILAGLALGVLDILFGGGTYDCPHQIREIVRDIDP